MSSQAGAYPETTNHPIRNTEYYGTCLGIYTSHSYLDHD